MMNTQEYNSPKLYDCEYGNFISDFDIFCGAHKGNYALDLACGTGRITIHLARKGWRCTGIDKNGSMLAEAQQKTKNLKLDITYVKQDMRYFNVNQTFDLITMGGNAFQALLNEQD